MSDVPPKSTNTWLLKHDDFTKVNDLRKAVVDGTAKQVQDRTLMALTMIESLNRQVLALTSFFMGAESISTCSFVGDVPAKVMADLSGSINNTRATQARMKGCQLRLEQSKAELNRAITISAEYASVDAYVADLSRANRKASELVTFTDGEKEALLTQAKANADSCDRANNTIRAFMEAIAKRTAIMLYDDDLELIDRAKGFCSDGLDVAGDLSGDVFDQAIAGLKLLLSLLTDLVKEATIEVKASGMTSEAAFAKLGQYDIAIAAAKDTMRVVNLFLDAFGTVVPFWKYIRPVLETGTETFVNARITKAEQLDKEKAGDPKGFWLDFKEGLEKGFTAAAEELIKQLNAEVEKVLTKGAFEIPQDLLIKTAQVVVKAFAEQIIGRMPIEPEKSLPGPSLTAYLDDLKASYKAGLLYKSPDIEAQIDALAYA